ncbi:restriction endonuclease subunit S [Vibrio sp. 2-Bac 85]
MKFEDFAQINPKVQIPKNSDVSFVEMADLIPSIRSVNSSVEKPLKGSGSKFSNCDTLFSRITPCLQNGKISQVKNLTNNIGFGSTEFFVFRGREGVSISDFVYYLSQSELIKEPAIKSMVGASGRQRADLDVIRNIDIKQYSIDDQIQIVGLLSNYDNLIENNNRRIAILEDMAQSLYREWFVNFRYPNHEDNLDADGKPKLIDSPLGQIPTGWEVKRIKDLGDVNTGKTPSKKKQEYYNNADVPFLKTPDMHGAIFSVDIGDYLSLEGANSQKNKFVPANSVCVSCIGARAGVVTITSEKLQTNQQINSVVLNDTKYREYFYLFAVSLHQKIHALGSSGATMTNVNKSKFEGIEVVVPPEEVIQGFSSKTASSFDLILNLQKRNKNLKKQRDMLLPKLISGQIEL